MVFLWFASGIVMMYVEYPNLTQRERVNASPLLDLDSINISLADIHNGLSEKTITQLELLSVLNRPVYKLTHFDNTQTVIYADNGDILDSVMHSEAEQSAALYAENSGIAAQNNAPEYLTSVELDQWTLVGGLSQHKPLYKVDVNNAEGTILYVSSSTAEVVHDTHKRERMWNWLGSTIHWVYPIQLRKHSNLWVNVVLILSFAGIISVVTGSIVGLLRLRLKRRYKNGAVTPYTGIQKWHHVLGITFALFIAMFVVSGLFSMNPFGIFDNKTSAFQQVSRYTGGSYNLSEFDQSLNNLKNNPEKMKGIKELSWQMLDGEGLLIAKKENNDKALDPIRSITNLDAAELEQKTRNAITQLLPNNELIKLQTVSEYDNYYYSTHNRYMPLPVFRARFSDAENTWYYIDATTSEVLFRSTQKDRIKRWLYNGLHSLDFRFLLANRPLWDIVVIALSVAGIVFSLTSLIIAWRRLRRTKLFKT